MLDLIKGAGRTSAEQLKYTQIKTNGGTQMRAGLNQDTVGAYADTMRHNNSYVPFPPIIVYFDGTDYWLGDGFHRHEAAFQAFGSSCTIPAEVRAGTRRDAILHAAGANAEHGLPRSAADKRRAVQTLLQDEEWRTWSNYKIAEACKVSEAFVRKVKGELNIETTHETQYIHPRTGQPATMNTQKIGQANNDAATEREITRLHRWLIERGWGTLYDVMPKTCYISKNGGPRFTFNNREDKAGELAALRSAKAHEEAEMKEFASQFATEPVSITTIQDPAPTPTNPAAQRREAASALLRNIDALLADLEQVYGALTGKYTDIPPVRRNFIVIRAELTNLIETLSTKG